ncbi:hypothetical protein ACTXLT_03125 [Brachybacterium alimentarium]|uniref:hypothetical protein n=1 Tax=Brachybacterium alimentarium TaxID=47845 RepID=UPI00403E0162
MTTTRHSEDHKRRPGAVGVRRWQWRNKFDPSITETGALARRGDHKLFIRGDDLRTVANALHALADELEAEQR